MSKSENIEARIKRLMRVRYIEITKRIYTVVDKATDFSLNRRTPVISYLNVQSLKAHKDDIMSDPVLQLSLIHI